MLRKAMSAALLALAIASTSAAADELIIDGVGTTDSGQHPQRGLEKSSVAENWGQPGAQTGAVGDPPISSWEYDDFVVYFEYDRVLHSVARR